MSSEGSFHRASVLHAIERWHAGNLDELQAHRLKDLLREDPAARQLFVEYGDMLAALDLVAAVDPVNDQDMIARRTLERDRRRWRNLRRWGAGLALLMSVACVAAAVTILPAIGDRLRLARFHGDGQHVDSIASGPAAVIAKVFQTGVAASLPAVTGELPEAGEQFFPGGELRIAAAGQFVHLNLKRGVELLVEGPAHLIFDDGNSVQLKEGQLVGSVRPEGVGFTVFLPHGQLQDLGTVFGVSARNDESTVTVLSGRVECRLSSSTGVPAEPLLVRAGENVRLDPTRVAPVLVAEPDAALAHVTGIHCGVLQSSGEVEFCPLPAPKPKVRRSFEVGKILIFPESRDSAIMWNEATQSFVRTDGGMSSEDLSLMLAAVPEHRSVQLAEGAGQAPIRVDSYLVSMHSLGSGKLILEGSMTFQGEILAVYTSRDGLVATDHFSAEPGFAEEWKDQSPGARGSKEENDHIQIAGDGRTLNVTLQASGAGDQLRVLVKSAPGS